MSVFSNFEKQEISNGKIFSGGADTNISSYIKITHGISGLDGYADPQYNDGTYGDYNNSDCR